MSGPYATAAQTYWQSGWRGVLPLPARAKKDPPRGFTGAGGVDPSFPDVYAWTEGREGIGNIALRLPIDVIGIDVDAYDGKAGAATIDAAEAAYGKLPPTWRTTSRDDGVSGIRLYRVPPGMEWAQIGPGIETIQRRHRYAVVWPSLHPEGRTYRWIDPSGVVSTVIPHLDDLPSLPQTWVDAYVKGDAADVPRNSMPSARAASWLAGLTGSMAEPCRRMKESATSDGLALGRAEASAHDLGCQATARLVRLAAEGHSGVMVVMPTLHKAFIDNVTNARRHGSTRSPLEAEAEWRDLLVSAVNLVSADMPEAPSCDCHGGLTALIVGDPSRDRQPATDGATALAPQADPKPEVVDTADAETLRTTWWPRNLEPVLSGEQTEPPPTVLTRNDGQPLWYAGKINGLIGESESGKTWVALLAVAQELQAGNRVLYLDFEDAAPGIISRLRALGVEDGDLAVNLDYSDPAESLSTAASEDVAELLATYSYSLIVIDGFNAAMTLLGLDLMSNTDVTKFFQLLLRPLAKTGAAVAYVDHIGKNAADDSKGGIGAQAKRAMTTGCVIKVKVGEPFGRGMNGRLFMGVDKDRAGHVRGASGMGRDAGVAELTSDAVSGAVGVVLAAPDMATRTERQSTKLEGLMEAVSEWLRTGPESTSKNAARGAVSGRAVDVEAALDALVNQGFVARTKAGSGYNHTPLKPYLVRSSGVVPSSSGTGGPNPSNDLVPSSRLYRRDEDESSEAELGLGVGEEATSSRPRKPVEMLDCNGCGRSKPRVIIETWKGYCSECARERRDR